MKKTCLLIVLFITILQINAFAENKKLRVIKQGNGYSLSFYPVLVKGIIENMRYFYNYRVKIAADISRPLSIYKIEVNLPSDSRNPTVFATPSFLHPGKFFFELDIRRRDNVEVDSFTIKFFFSPAVEQQQTERTQPAGNTPPTAGNTPQTASTGNAQTESNAPVEYVIKKSDYREISAPPARNNPSGQNRQ